jgi:hypothetical protein
MMNLVFIGFPSNDETVFGPTFGLLGGRIGQDKLTPRTKRVFFGGRRFG